LRSNFILVDPRQSIQHGVSRSGKSRSGKQAIKRVEVQRAKK
jgi:hypothetical protein